MKKLYRKIGGSGIGRDGLIQAPRGDGDNTKTSMSVNMNMNMNPIPILKLLYTPRESIGARILRGLIGLQILIPIQLYSCGPSDDAYMAEDRSAWGTFYSWAASSKFRPAYEAMLDFSQKSIELKALYASLESERMANNAAEQPATDVPVAIYPETSGSFEFVQILSQYEGTSVFRASDGLFVLHLQPGDSFSAYPGQSVYLTMHNRGETMSLTIGQAVVFRSGSSRTRRQHFSGFTPDRTNEAGVRHQMEVLQERLEERVDASRARLRGAFYARIDVRLEQQHLRPNRFLVFDARGPVYCVTDRSPSEDCPVGSIEHITFEDLLRGSTNATKLQRQNTTNTKGPVTLDNGTVPLQ